eukprot:1310685-Amphidinium_carterae.1
MREKARKRLLVREYIAKNKKGLVDDVAQQQEQARAQNIDRCDEDRQEPSEEPFPSWPASRPDWIKYMEAHEAEYVEHVRRVRAGCRQVINQRVVPDAEEMRTLEDPQCRVKLQGS